eukprot:TRINITY_DN8054_c0_g1_i1.p1 TRINITY_DN8054_c0_g1~~TRINITY_DN8054_c0_g1_i1.p1  ORF type:complete len:182 (+),score=27.20 TRINITY_DN8054_c0_g1_i1:30-575(+)
MEDKVDRLPNIETLNTLSLSDFGKVVNTLFETTIALSQRLYNQKPFESYHRLIDAVEKEVEKMNFDEVIDLVNAHPRIGEARNKVSKLSFIEQGYNKQQDEPEHVYKDLADLNNQYERKFGFKFVIFVNGRKKADIIPIIKQRLQNYKVKVFDYYKYEYASISLNLGRRVKNRNSRFSINC